MGCSFFQRDMSVMGQANQSIDYLFIAYTSLGALTDPEDRKQGLKKIARVLKTGGIAFISGWHRLWPGSLGVNWMQWIVLWLLRMLRRLPYGPGNRLCWEECICVL